jgi:hypothetical protein
LSEEIRAIFARKQCGTKIDASLLIMSNKDETKESFPIFSAFPGRAFFLTRDLS